MYIRAKKIALLLEMWINVDVEPCLFMEYVASVEGDTIQLIRCARLVSRVAEWCNYLAVWWLGYTRPGARLTDGISIEFEIRPHFAVLQFKVYSTDHNEILRRHDVACATFHYDR